ncbi:hypothetical protein MYX78_06385 [Acidobacteria bacterium AH-259-G07]|nr:hypothetical protein [Acidobacteria bacterium AH-259-G07]
MQLNVAQKLIQSHLLEGEMVSGQEIGIRIGQTLTQDATGTPKMILVKARVKNWISRMPLEAAKCRLWVAVH